MATGVAQREFLSTASPQVAQALAGLLNSGCTEPTRRARTGRGQPRVRNLVGDAPQWPIGEVWNYHDWSTIGNQRVGTYQAAIDARLGESGSLGEFAARAQFVNYESHRAMFEAWNANLWQDATGLLLWMSHPAWHSTVWQTYDYDLDVNGAHYGARKGCEPLHVQADPGTWQVGVVNQPARSGLARQVKVTAQAYNSAGN
ncbi:hypothetical protein [Micromonospora coriariae]|uniref:hypothetical protein n=1 Tax=Micromonospora coriariae TaxID=285665 RepID=UPI0018D549BF|nr:hypothetical protein [Micromonospora coriariae]